MRDKCRNCGAKRGDSGEWYDDDYCSGKCKTQDGGEVEAAAPVSAKKASFEDYRKNPRRYHRRLDPEKLNWGEPLSAPQLKQAGLRSNRQPIPGDWDFVEENKDE